MLIRTLDVSVHLGAQEATREWVIGITGDPDEVERFIEVIRPFGLKEMMRTGRIAMTRGAAQPSALEHTNKHRAPLGALGSAQ